jgi:aminomethyltransferase
MHEALGAKLVEFGGWEMPLAYPEGTVAEHRACREGTVVFDVSHLGTVALRGDDALAQLQATLTNDLGKIAPGRAQYTHLLDEEGSVLDDIIVWWRAEGVFDVMPNASNTDRVVAALGGEDVTERRTVLALQGPQSRAVLSGISKPAAQVPRFAVRSISIQGADAVVAGTGYTGEDGVEIALPNDAAGPLFEALLEAGAIPAGLGARDTLRLEAGLPLHGHELGAGITPIQAGLSWVVGWDKPTFVGREALLAEREVGPRRLLRGLRSHSRQPLRDHATILARSTRVGETTSGNYSPMLGCGIALGFVDASAGVELGDELQVELRGRQLGATVVPLPFWPSRS